MKRLIYYMGLDYPMELDKELDKENVILIKETEYVNERIRKFIKNNFIYEIIFDELKIDNVKMLLKKLIINNIFNECNVVELYCGSDDLIENSMKYVTKNLDEDIFFEEGCIVNIGNFNTSMINQSISKNDKMIKILGYQIENNKFIIDTLSEAIFYYGDNGCIDEIGMDVYISDIDINNKKTELDFSQVTYNFEDENLENSINAFNNSIYIKYKQEGLIDNGFKNICITRSIYEIKKNIKDTMNVTIKIDFGEETKDYNFLVKQH